MPKEEQFWVQLVHAHSSTRQFAANTKRAALSPDTGGSVAWLEFALLGGMIALQLILTGL